ncbi:MAG: restriction endonuclease subunit S [Thermoanaerobaculia bacterium]|nr:restriction endonuclease subunit S [Thermoanaerobaculia bacterium]
MLITQRRCSSRPTCASGRGLATYSFCVRGSTTGRMNWADQPYAIGRGVAAIRHKSDPDLQPFVRAVIEYGLPDLLAQATGSTFPNVSADQLAKLPWPELEVREQRAIAHILGTLDDKIELNRRMSETLEAMARALFKSWFVDFEPVRAKAEGRDPGLPNEIADLFPDSFRKEETGDIPKGWSIGTIGEEFELIMGQSPPGETYNESGEGLPFYQGRADFGRRYPARRVYCTKPSRFASRGDALVSVRAPVGDVNLASERCAIGRGVAAIRHRSGARGYTFQTMRALTVVFETFEANGTVFGSVGRREFHGIRCLRPPASLVRAFEAYCAGLDDRIEVACQEGAALTALRDTLLPRLLSGELRVGDASRFLEEAS